MHVFLKVFDVIWWGREGLLAASQVFPLFPQFITRHGVAGRLVHSYSCYSHYYHWRDEGETSLHVPPGNSAPSMDKNSFSLIEIMDHIPPSCPILSCAKAKEPASKNTTMNVT